VFKGAHVYKSISSSFIRSISSSKVAPSRNGRILEQRGDEQQSKSMPDRLLVRLAAKAVIGFKIFAYPNIHYATEKMG